MGFQRWGVYWEAQAWQKNHFIFRLHSLNDLMHCDLNTETQVHQRTVSHNKSHLGISCYLSTCQAYVCTWCFKDTWEIWHMRNVTHEKCDDVLYCVILNSTKFFGQVIAIYLFYIHETKAIGHIGHSNCNLFYQIIISTVYTVCRTAQSQRLTLTKTPY